MSSSIPFLPPVGAVKFSPWEAFDQVWTSAVGYPAEEFKFVPGETPMATYEKLVDYRLQIAQFVIDLIAIYFASYNYWASAYHPSLPHVGTCAGESYAAFAGCAIISS
ncbi:hypothetical protein DID88_010360 [Monilinia fructigena]|uniref:Uncharacterized protein n=1 Tax=Monilinia fructigena TaxID=38457 RepID=A0A395IMA2_9HELO|nr:hypothetical protein DID88_010360 [Monilinia fructigena]